MTREERTSVVIARKIASIEGDDPKELEPLYDVIDTDALDDLVHSSDSQHVTVEFEYGEYTIRVDGPGEITVLRTDQHTGSVATEPCCD